MELCREERNLTAFADEHLFNEEEDEVVFLPREAERKRKKFALQLGNLCSTMEDFDYRSLCPSSASAYVLISVPAAYVLIQSPLRTPGWYHPKYP